jgi:hypothetical protein
MRVDEGGASAAPNVFGEVAVDATEVIYFMKKTRYLQPL